MNATDLASTAWAPRQPAGPDPDPPPGPQGHRVAPAALLPLDREPFAGVQAARGGQPAQPLVGDPVALGTEQGGQCCLGELLHPVAACLVTMWVAACTSSRSGSSGSGGSRPAGGPSAMPSAPAGGCWPLPAGPGERFRRHGVPEDRPGGVPGRVSRSGWWVCHGAARVAAWPGVR